MGMTRARPQARGWAMLGLALVTVPLAGCTVGPAFVAPAPRLPDQFKAALPSAHNAGAPADPAKTAPAAAQVDAAWWRRFGSPELTGLIETAAQTSPDLDAAIARIEQADAQARIAGSALLPELSAEAGQDWQHAGYAGAPRRTSATESRSYDGKLTASWELDFWGKNRSARQAARLSAQAARQDRDAVWLSTASSIADTYIAAAGASERVRIAQRNLHDEEQILAAFRARLDAGTASALDVSQQEALVAGTRARVPGLRATARQNTHALAALTGKLPEEITLHPQALETLSVPEVSPGLPASLLRRRPDIAEAETQLAAQTATLRERIADYYPSLTLTASGGVSSLALDAITGPGSLAASFASSLTQTIFDNGAKQGQIDVARAKLHELAADYTKTLLSALADVETALSDLHLLGEQLQLQEAAVATARRAAEIARAQMDAGTVDIVTVLNTETTLFNDEDTLATLRISYLQAGVALYRALGGGWQRDASAPGAPAGQTQMLAQTPAQIPSQAGAAKQTGQGRE